MFIDFIWVKFCLFLVPSLITVSFPGRLLSVCFYADRWLFGGTADSTVLRWLISNGISDAKMSVHKNLPKLSRNTNPNSNGIERRGGPSLASPLPEDTQVWSIIALPFHGVTITGDSLGHVTVWDVITSTALKIFRHVSWKIIE